MARQQDVDHRRRWFALAVVPIAVIGSAVLVWSASQEAFSGSTDSPGNQWTAGSLALTNDTTGTYATTGTFMFNPGNVFPGDSGQWCVNVKNAGTGDAKATNPVKFYAPAPPNLASNQLAQYLMLTVEESTDTVTGGNTGSCSGFTTGSTVYNANIAGLPSDYTTAVAPSGTGLLAVGATMAYRLTWTLPASTPNGIASQTLTGVDFAWATQIGS